MESGYNPQFPYDLLKEQVQNRSAVHGKSNHVCKDKNRQGRCTHVSRFGSDGHDSKSVHPKRKDTGYERSGMPQTVVCTWTHHAQEQDKSRAYKTMAGYKSITINTTWTKTSLRSENRGSKWFTGCCIVPRWKNTADGYAYTGRTRKHHQTNMQNCWSVFLEFRTIQHLQYLQKLQTLTGFQITNICVRTLDWFKNIPVMRETSTMRCKQAKVPNAQMDNRAVYARARKILSRFGNHTALWEDICARGKIQRKDCGGKKDGKDHLCYAKGKQTL